MKILQKLPYKLKTALPILAFVGASIVPAACNNDDDDHYDKTDSKHDVELLWTAHWGSEITEANIKINLYDPKVNNIYLKYFPAHTFRATESNYLRKEMEWRIALDPKRVHGRGNIIFVAGPCAKEDSLWFVEHGWTVNSPLQPDYLRKISVRPPVNTTKSTKQR